MYLIIFNINNYWYGGSVTGDNGESGDKEISWDAKLEVDNPFTKDMYGIDDTFVKGKENISVTESGSDGRKGDGREGGCKDGRNGGGCSGYNGGDETNVGLIVAFILDSIINSLKNHSELIFSLLIVSIVVL